MAKISDMKTEKEKLKQNNWSSKKKKKTGLQIKIMKETKNLKIGTEKKHVPKKLFYVAKNLSV